MRLTTAALALLIATAMNDQVQAADSCKACSDYRKRCMANYPGPTCKIDYDICMKACRKK